MFRWAAGLGTAPACSWHGWGWHRGVVHPWDPPAGWLSLLCSAGKCAVRAGRDFWLMLGGSEESLEEQDVPLGQSVLG